MEALEALTGAVDDLCRRNRYELSQACGNPHDEQEVGAVSCKGEEPHQRQKPESARQFASSGGPGW